MLKPFQFIFCTFLLIIQVHSQNYDQDYFISPLEIPLFLSGNFGELRSNHFHAGLDIKTQGVEGQKVFAVADGYVSRIKVSASGYGNALYITHSNGYTSVYGHLQKYNSAITAYIKQEQYAKESFEIQLFPAPFKFQVKQGELVAYSGNTGGSGGPHLHFEIRETKSEHPMNPMLFGFPIKDNLNPDIYAVTIYPLNDTSYINGQNSSKPFRAKGNNGVYTLIDKFPILLYGHFGFGIEGVDRMTGTGNSYGLDEIRLSINEDAIFEQKIREFAFDEGRYINAHIDYETYYRTGRRVQLSHVKPGNRLRIYKTLKKNGSLLVANGESYEIKYELIDLEKNTSVLRFMVEGKNTAPARKTSSLNAKPIQFFPFNQRNTFIKDNILIDIPKGALYEDLNFEFRVEAPLKRAISDTYFIHNQYTPLHKSMTVSIKVPPMEEKLKNKCLIFSSTDGKSLNAEGGNWNSNTISVKTRTFGAYGVAIDTVPPKIVPLTISNAANLSSKIGFSVKISDDFSGIGEYIGKIDGKWILMEYDKKSNRLVHFFDEKTARGTHLFELIVKDQVGNQSNYNASFTR